MVGAVNDDYDDGGDVDDDSSDGSEDELEFDRLASQGSVISKEVEDKAPGSTSSSLELTATTPTRPNDPENNKIELNYREIITNLTKEMPTNTKRQMKRNEILEIFLNSDKFPQTNSFCDMIASHIQDVLNPKHQASTKELTAMCRSYNRFVSSIECRDVMCVLLGHEPDSDEYGTCVYLADAIKAAVLRDYAQNITRKQEQVPQNRCSDTSDHGLSKLRYLGGRCLAKTKHAVTKAVKHNLYNRNRQKYMTSKNQLELLESLNVTEVDIIEKTSDKSSLEETLRRQNARRSLTHISDACFEFFKLIERKRTELENLETFHLYGGSVITRTERQLLEDTELKNTWSKLFPHGCSSDTTYLYTDIICRFLRVASNQFRKHLVVKLGKKTTSAHRTEIQKRKDSSTENSINNTDQKKKTLYEKLKSVKLAAKGKESVRENQHQRKDE
ncbi:uncharacterized protein [Ptychodera flava]|uniref:uncharacterized protein n=1 Tax=Ptychodera flava TaxID=63121 RepID=UPI00396A241D